MYEEFHVQLASRSELFPGYQAPLPTYMWWQGPASLEVLASFSSPVGDK